MPTDLGTYLWWTSPFLLLPLSYLSVPNAPTQGWEKGLLDQTSFHISYPKVLCIGYHHHLRFIVSFHFNIKISFSLEVEKRNLVSGCVNSGNHDKTFKINPAFSFTLVSRFFSLKISHLFCF